MLINVIMSSNLLTLTIDWEDFGQIIQANYLKISAPPSNTIERQTNVILDILSEARVNATFFILGMVARFRADLVKRIADQGHEIALHGNNHIDLRRSSQDAIRDDISTSLKIVSDITGKQVYGFRAPFFSIDQRNLLSVLEVLVELGLQYDSSVFPMKLPRYGIKGFSSKDSVYQLPNGTPIVEFPITVGEYFGRKFPVSGGGYIRLMPKFFVHKVFEDLKKKKKNGVIYMHPYEFDTQKIDVNDNYNGNAVCSAHKALYLNFKWNLFRQSIRDKIRMLLKENSFITLKEKVDYVKENGNRPILLGCSQ
jgi:polysaccharide deacetylase family protein (PEP-CTERM system associated)